jgi:phage terminase large subunit-like protein
MHVSGKWAGRSPTVPRVCIEIPRRNGKRSLPEGMTLYPLFADREPEMEVYSAAPDREHADIVPELAWELEEAQPILASRADKFKRSIVYALEQRSHNVSSADEFTKRELNASGVVADELHAERTR